MPAWWPRRGHEDTIRQHQRERVDARILLARTEVAVDRLEGVLHRYEQLLFGQPRPEPPRRAGEG